MTLERKYKCTFCDKNFTRKTWFDKHSCEKKKRFLRRNNIDVIRAMRLFNYWQKREGLLRKGKEKTMEEFCKSPVYNTFLKLSEFTRNQSVITPFRYVDWIVARSIPERDWCNTENLEHYHAYLKSLEDPSKQAEKTCKHIKSWCEERGIASTQFFSNVKPGQAIEMVRENKLSPWVLLSYEPSVKNLLDPMKDEALHTLDEYINLRYWIDKVEKEINNTTKVREICERDL